MYKMKKTLYSHILRECMKDKEMRFLSPKHKVVAYVNAHFGLLNIITVVTTH